MGTSATRSTSAADAPALAAASINVCPSTWVPGTAQNRSPAATALESARSAEKKSGGSPRQRGRRPARASRRSTCSLRIMCCGKGRPVRADSRIDWSRSFDRLRLSDRRGRALAGTRPSPPPPRDRTAAPTEFAFSISCSESRLRSSSLSRRPVPSVTGRVHSLSKHDGLTTSQTAPRGGALFVHGFVSLPRDVEAQLVQTRSR